ncbi:MAG: hypothetical protein MMC33_004602 [Icmadophila ericetorum]|nr:hypothetical protein [Icmadophila ericetorum]
MGLGIYKSTHYWDAPCAEIEDGARSLWWSTVVQNFEVIDEDSLPEGVYYGVSFTAFALDPVQYLRYLYEKVQALGARVVRAKVPVEDGLAGVVKAAREAVAKDVVGVAEGDDVLGYVNATGIAAGKICGDEAMGVQRGQTVLIKGEAREIRTRVGAWKDRIATVIPRRGAGMSVVGVSKETGVWDTKVDDEMTKNLLEAGKKLAPELLKENGEFEVVSVQVGLRPSREGGPRVELEVLPAGEVVVHEYGHGGAGYQNSIGSANQVLRLLQAHFKQNEDTKV